MNTAVAEAIEPALTALRAEGVIAYPTEFCFGLGCDPKSHAAVQRILDIKRREQAQGLILVAANEQQVVRYAELKQLQHYPSISQSWPGATTWLLPRREDVPQWISGAHTTIAMRVSSHPLVLALCREFGGAIVSTSANRHGKAALKTAQQVQTEMGEEVDCVVAGEVSWPSSSQSASAIFDAASGQRLR